MMIFTREELEEIIREQEEYIADLEFEIAELKQRTSEKIAKDFDENKCLVATLLINLVKEVE